MCEVPLVVAVQAGGGAVVVAPVAAIAALVAAAAGLAAELTTSHLLLCLLVPCSLLLPFSPSVGSYCLSLDSHIEQHLNTSFDRVAYIGKGGNWPARHASTILAILDSWLMFWMGQKLTCITMCVNRMRPRHHFTKYCKAD